MVILEFESLDAAIAARNSHYYFSHRERKFASLVPLQASDLREFPTLYFDHHLLDHRSGSPHYHLTRRLLHLGQSNLTFEPQTCPEGKTRRSPIHASFELWLS